MISSIKIDAFRGVREGQLDGLGPISILVGPNNSGKSTCLEAVALGGAASDARRVAIQLLKRGGPPHDALAHVIAPSMKKAAVTLSFHDGATCECHVSIGGVRSAEHFDRAKAEGLRDPMKRVEVWLSHAGHDGTGKRESTICTYVDERGALATPTLERGVAFNPFRFQLVDVQAVREPGTLETAYTAIEKVGRVKAVVQLLARSMKGLTDLRILKSEDDFILHAIFEGQPPVPVYLAGDGAKRLVELASAILGVDPDGVVLLEEPECFQHPRYLQALASLLVESAKAKRQIILSTHSIELVDMLLAAAETENLDYPIVHRLRLVEGKLSGVALTREQAMTSRNDLLEDLRA